MAAGVICCPVCKQRVGLRLIGAQPVAHWAAPGIPLRCPQGWPSWARGVR